MTREMLNKIENDYWEEKADPIDMTEVFDLASKAIEQEPTVAENATTKKNLSVEAQEPCEDCCNGDQIEKAKLCQRSYLAGMEHKQEPKTDVLDKIRAEIAEEKIELDLDIGNEILYNNAIDDCLQIIDKYRQEG